MAANTLMKNGAGGVPRYTQLATLFRRHIATGHWKVGDQIPTVEGLAEEYGVARATVRHALSILEAENLIERFRAKGTFVTQQPQEQLWCEVETDWSGLLRPREAAVIELISEETGKQPPPLMHDSGKRTESYRHFRRKHSRNNQPFLLASVYIDEQLSHHISHDALADKTALSLLVEIEGLQISDVHQTMTLGQADMITAEQLEIPLNASVAYVQRSVSDDKGRLILVSDGVYRGDIVRVDMKLK